MLFDCSCMYVAYHVMWVVCVTLYVLHVMLFHYMFMCGCGVMCSGIALHCMFVRRVCWHIMLGDVLC